jgi:hypothetical protein
LRRAIGELSFVDGKYVEAPDPEETELATFAVMTVARKAEEFERLYDGGFTQQPPDASLLSVIGPS